MRLDDRDFKDLDVEDLETVKKRVERKKKRKKRKGSGIAPWTIPVIFVLLLLLAIFFVSYGGGAVEALTGFKVNSDLSACFGEIESNEAGIILNKGYETEIRAFLEDGRIYLPYDYVKTNLNDWFYHDENEGLILYTTPEGTDRLDIGDDAREIGGGLCLSTDLVMKYTDLEFEDHTGEDVPYIFIRNAWGEYSAATVKKKTAFRSFGDKKSDVMAALEEGEKVRVLDPGTEWSEVQRENGSSGFVASSDLDEYKDESDSAPGNVPDMEFPVTGFNNKISLGWHQVMSTVANDTVYDILKNDTAVNVLGPTWYSLTDTEGNFKDISSAAYVEAAHEAGKKVWSVVDNFNVEGFVPDAGTHEVLSYTSKRKKLIDALVESVKASGADGINVDFEQLSADSGQHFAQFIKELSVACHDNSLILSVDNYVPKAYSLHYHREVQGKVCDFCVIMGYDEYTSGSADAGPVASLDFVEHGIDNTLVDVDASRVINGVPFYTRLWETSNGVVKNSQALGMKEAADTFKTHGVTPSWDDGAGCNYGEYEADGSLYRMWLEDEESLNAKLSVMKSRDLAGVAFWKLGFESKEIWDEVEAYLAG